MKLAAIGAALLVGLVGGYFLFPAINPKSDIEAKFVEAEAKSALIKVSASWSSDAFLTVSSRRLRANNERESVSRYLKAQGATYGTIVSSERWRFFREPGSYWATCDAEFSRQEARVEMRLVAEAGRWRIDDLVLRPKSLGKGQLRI